MAARDETTHFFLGFETVYVLTLLLIFVLSILLVIILYREWSIIQKYLTVFALLLIIFLIPFFVEKFRIKPKIYKS